MITSRTPFRISFVGGGSDLPSFYRKKAGAVLSTTINKFMYIHAHPYYDREKVLLKYSETEYVDNVQDIKHRVFRECLKEFGLKGISLVSDADIPSKTGLGSSSSFTVGLLHVLYAYTNKLATKEKLASEAARIEMVRLNEMLGKQDHYAAAYGGMNMIEFFPDERVCVTPLYIKNDVYDALEKSLLLFYTGDVRDSYNILREHAKQHTIDEKFNEQCRMVDMVWKFRDALSEGKLDRIGPLLDEGWQLKQKLVNSISNTVVNDYYKRGIAAGALGGKLLGAGGGGFLLFYCPPERQDAVRREFSDLWELQFKFEKEGSKIVYIEQGGINVGFFR